MVVATKRRVDRRRKAALPIFAGCSSSACGVVVGEGEEVRSESS
jgi:hypothetical protein